MGTLLETFANAIENPEDDEKNIIMNEFMSDGERLSWEKLVEVFDAIDILNVGRDVIKVSKKFKTNSEEDVAILAYVKLLELMVKRAKDVQSNLKDSQPTQAEYDGSMFG
jgi:hypothetical protein